MTAFNLWMFLVAVGIIGWIITYRPIKGADICSFDIISILVLSDRKSGIK